MTMSTSFHAGPDTQVSAERGNLATWLKLERNGDQLNIFAGNSPKEQLDFVRELAGAVNGWYAQLAGQQAQRHIEAMGLAASAAGE